MISKTEQNKLHIQEISNCRGIKKEIFFFIQMEKNNNMIKVCVTGASSYIGSWLVKKLLYKGYVVHATLRNKGDVMKVFPLKSLLGADTRLKLFEADLYNPESFEESIQGCEYVFHVATPMPAPNEISNWDPSKAAVTAVKSIAQSCIKSGTVKRLIYTASVMTTAVVKEDGTGFKDVFDEDCWTPLDCTFPHYDQFTKGYVHSKTLSEKEVLKINETKEGGLEVVALNCALVGGDTVLSYLSDSQIACLSQLTAITPNLYDHLRLLQEMLGSVPLIHIDDVCEAHIFCMEKPSMTGRFLCTSTCPTHLQMGKYMQENYPEFDIEEKFIEGPETGIKCGSTKLIDSGFEYKYDLKKLLDDTVACARRLAFSTK
ncbi:hypothetical protein GIB67_011232 [Kingdonia uniflora]|uniref:NAD-dependent epimerase/dehydratase domain-containing protein n=1 Tax=Kingdonia uniflora TaxID=39325 RepID=A0A7J7M423_9MAGN|nr:hypothetical protein GIB67_011232 [Kingdonia uniflora]